MQKTYHRDKEKIIFFVISLLLCSVAVTWVALRRADLGIILLVAMFPLLFALEKNMRSAIASLIPSLMLLSLYPITAHFTVTNLLISIIILAISVIVPRLLLRYMHGDASIFTVSFLQKSRWK